MFGPVFHTLVHISVPLATYVVADANGTQLVKVAHGRGDYVVHVGIPKATGEQTARQTEREHLPLALLQVTYAIWHEHLPSSAKNAAHPGIAEPLREAGQCLSQRLKAHTGADLDRTRYHSAPRELENRIHTSASSARLST